MDSMSKVIGILLAMVAVAVFVAFVVDLVRIQLSLRRMRRENEEELRRLKAVAEYAFLEPEKSGLARESEGRQRPGARENGLPPGPGASVSDGKDGAQ